MLFIENEVFKLPDALLTELRGELRGGKTLKFPKELRTTTKDDKGNIVVEWPAMRSIPFVDFVDLDMDSHKTKSESSKNVRFVQVRYAESVSGPKDNPMYKPSGLQEFFTLHEEQAELYWYLKYVSRFVKFGMNAPSNKLRNFSCVIADPEKDEREEAAKDALIYEAMGIIYNRPEMGGIAEEKLRNIAAAFGINDSLKGRIDGIKLKLKRAVEIDEIKALASGDPNLRGYKYLVKLATEEFDFSLRANISKAIELDIIEYVGNLKGWYFLAESRPGEARKYEEKIVACEVTVDSKENFLLNFMNRNQDIKVRLEQKLGDKLKQPSSNSEADYENLKSQKEKFEADGDSDNVIEIIEKMLLIKPNNNKLKSELKNLKEAKAV